MSNLKYPFDIFYIYLSTFAIKQKSKFLAIWNQLSFQDPASTLIIHLINFHEHAILIVTLVTLLIGATLYKLFIDKFVCRTILEAHNIEIIWTTLPALILQALALPSLRLLYLIDELDDPSITLKITGNQWYWTYEYFFIDESHKDYITETILAFNSYILPTSDLSEGQYRLLEVDHPAVLPINEEIRFIITSSDVIHAWALPSLGIKVDAVPGRLNQTAITINRPGIFYGQCSEICGANHSFIPIVLEAVTIEGYLEWIDYVNSIAPTEYTEE